MQLLSRMNDIVMFLKMNHLKRSKYPYQGTQIHRQQICAIQKYENIEYRIDR